MKDIQYLTDANGNKKGIFLNISNNLQSEILNAWLNEPSEKQNLANLYFAKFLCEITTDKAKKKELNKIIAEIESIELTAPTVRNIKVASPDFVAYTIDGKGLTQKEYKDYVLGICQATDKGNYKTQSEIFKKYEAYEK